MRAALVEAGRLTDPDRDASDAASAWVDDLEWWYRFDVPAVGPQTLTAMEAARCSALVVEAGKTLLLDREELLAAADRAGIAVEGFGPGA